MWLRFVYTGVVDSEVCLENTMDVLDLAAQHGMPALKDACEQRTVAMFSPEFNDGLDRSDMEYLHSSCPRLVQTARLHNLRRLEAAAFTFKLKRDAAVKIGDALIRFQFPHLLKEGFEDMRESVIVEMMRLAKVDRVSGKVTFPTSRSGPEASVEASVEAPSGARRGNGVGDGTGGGVRGAGDGGGVFSGGGGAV